MEIIVAVALTISAVATWIARSKWGHPIANPGLIYLGVILTSFAGFRWAVAFGWLDSTPDETARLTLIFVSFVQVGIILVMLAGREFHRTAEERYVRWAKQQHLIENGW